MPRELVSYLSRMKIQDYLVPYVIRKGPDGERAMDISSRMLEDRIVMCHGEIEDEMAGVVVNQLLYLDSVDDKPISLYVFGPGGSINAGCAIIDTMGYVKSPVKTIGLGYCASMCAMVLACGTKGERFALPNTRVLIHQATSATRGQVIDMEKQFNETKFMNDKMLEMLAEKTGKSKAVLKKDMDRDFWMSAKEAVEYGLIDKVLERAG